MSSTLVRPGRIVLLAVALLFGGVARLLAQNTVNLQGRVTGTAAAPKCTEPWMRHSTGPLRVNFPRRAVRRRYARIAVVQ